MLMLGDKLFICWNDDTASIITSSYPDFLTHVGYIPRNEEVVYRLMYLLMSSYWQCAEGDVCAVIIDQG